MNRIKKTLNMIKTAFTLTLTLNDESPNGVRNRRGTKLCKCMRARLNHIYVVGQTNSVIEYIFFSTKNQFEMFFNIMFLF